MEQAKHVVGSAKFGSKYGGTRSVPPFRLIPGITDLSLDDSKSLHDNLNDQAAVVIQIETLAGIDNLDAILTEVPAIDAVWLGSLDCRVSMGLPGNGGMGGPEPEWLEAKDKFQKILAKHDKPYAGFALGPDAKAMGEKLCWIVCAADVAALMGLAGTLAENRAMFPARNSSK